MISMDKLTLKSQEVLQASMDIALEHNHQVVEPEHLLSSLLQVSDTAIFPILEKRPPSASAFILLMLSEEDAIN